MPDKLTKENWKTAIEAARSLHDKKAKDYEQSKSLGFEPERYEMICLNGQIAYLDKLIKKHKKGERSTEFYEMLVAAV